MSCVLFVINSFYEEDGTRFGSKTPCHFQCSIGRFCFIRRPHMMNDYEEAIAAFGSTVERYSPNQEYP